MLKKTVGAVMVLALAATGVMACGADVDELGELEQDMTGVNQFCGGFANIPCPEGLVCVDDPRDDCDPNEGGADCGGICRKAPGPKDKCKKLDPNKSYVAFGDQCALVKFYCEPGYEPFFDACGCGCEYLGEPCGNDVCGAGEFCCNKSCGICAPDGGFCTQQVCAPT